MPLCKTIKTYEKKFKNNSSNVSKSVDAFNALFAQNLTKRLIGRRKKKPKLQLMELPPRTEPYLTDCSVTFNAEETFDKVRKGEVFKEVKVTTNLIVHNSSSDSSKSRIPQVSINFHSPIMTRKRVKQNIAAVSSDGSEQELLVQTNKNTTLDKPVTSNLLIEKEKKNVDVSSLSYIHLPIIAENKVISETCDNSNGMEWPCEPIFTDTFRERQTVHSSTPCVVAPFRKIVADTISPICKPDPNSSKLIEKSYDEIRKWDSNFPILEHRGTPLKGPVLRSSTRSLGVCVKERRRKSVTRNCYRKMVDDWKLNIEPKVCLKSSDMIDFKRIDQKLHFQPKVFINCDAVADFKGFTEMEQLQSTKNVNNFVSLNCQVFQNSHRITKSILYKMEHFSRKSVKNSGRAISTKKSVNNSVSLKSTSESSYEKCTRSIIKFLRTSRHKCVSNNINNRNSRLTMKKINVSEEEFLDIKEPMLSTSISKQDKVESHSTNTGKCFVTIRGYKNSNQHVSNDIRKCMQFKNFTDDILSEKEVSYSSVSKCISSFEETNSVASVITGTSTDEQSSKEKSACLAISLSNFETFEKIYCAKDHLDDTTNNLAKEEPYQNSIISVSDDDMNFYENDLINLKDTSKDHPITYSVEDLANDQELCLPKLNVQKCSEQQTVNSLLRTGCISKSNEEKRQTAFFERNNLKNVAEELLPSMLEKSTEITSCKTPLRSSRSLNFIIPSKKIEHSKNIVKRPSSAKIIILSDISLGFCSGFYHDDDTAKMYQDIYHDHSYTNLPEPESSQYLYGTTNNSGKKYVGQNEVSFNEDKYKNSNLNLSDIIESSFISSVDTVREDREKIFKKPIKTLNKPKTIALRAGKTYRRSLSLLRRNSVFDDVLSTNVCSNDCLCAKCLFRGKLNRSSCRRSFQIVPASPTGTLPSNSSLETYARKRFSYVQEQDLIDTDLDESLRNLSLISNSRSSLINHCDNSLPDVSAKDLVLRRCGQTEILPFAECYPRSILQHCQKIGEGVYGEVFLYRNQSGGTSVMKIIPIEGDQNVNGEKQKKFDEVVSEILISMELSNLRNNKKNFTSCFTEVQKVRCIRGSYPDRLLDLWDLYDETRGSENESPQVFPPDQIYIVLELANGGQDLESFVFNNALQVFAVFKQTACALAVAESQLKFEHRDLHWGNILISSVDKSKTLHFRLNGKDIEIDTHGVEVSIIDFTLSRVEFDGVVIFNDLSRDDELFVAKGDYQFEIYRLMQQNNSNEWQHFEPYSNILWLHYLLDKAVTPALRYKNNRTKIHKEYLGKLKKFKEQILSFHSVVEFVVGNLI